MTPERWAQLEDLFHQARALAPERRGAFLADACADSGVRREIESLIAQQDGTLLREGVEVAAAGVLPAHTRGTHEGRVLGPYVLGALIGSGGMGEVYHARDPRLGREVAIKVLPDTLAQQPERLARFDREARALASLNHPNIGAIYGIEESGGTRGLVLELVDGITLSERLPSGAMSITEALVFARQVAEALAAAHQKGIVHRDLKPANVKITTSNVVKVLDFGLAKIVAPVAEPDSLPVMATADGVVLGTVAYMSPEQARGLPVDKRTDIWAFGCVLYEMLAGTRAFAGQSSADVLGAIVSGDPDWTRLPADTPPRVRDVIRRCLAKDPERRIHDIADARIEIDEAMDFARDAGAGQRAAAARPRGWLLAAWLLGGMAICAVPLAIWLATAPPASHAPVVRASLELPTDVAIFAIGRGSSVAVSPDGTRIVYVGIAGGRRRLYVRPIDAPATAPLQGTEEATSPFFSPDGRWIGFVDATPGGRLKKVPVEGGAALTIVDSPPDGAERFVVQAGAWMTDDSIVFSSISQNRRGLWRVPAGGGNPVRVTTPARGELFHTWPQVVPARNAIIFTVWNNTSFDGARVVAQSLDGGSATELVKAASYGRVVIRDPDRAWLAYARPEGLYAAPFDLDRLQLTGSAAPVVDGVLSNLSGGAHFSVSEGGLLAYVAGGLDEINKTAVWVDRSGAATEIGLIRGLGFQYRISPDGRRLVRPNAIGPSRDLWIDDLTGREASRRLTFSGDHNFPLWTPDGTRVVYARELPGDSSTNIFWRAADGSGAEERLTSGSNPQMPRSVSPDGATLAYQENSSARGPDIWLLPLREPRSPRLLVGTPAADLNPVFSPNGRWVAYSSTLSGAPEIFLTSVANGERRINVSNGGGTIPRWSKDGRELFYRTRVPEQGAGEMMAASIDWTGPEPKVVSRRALFATPYQGEGDLAPDGRFLLLKRTPQESPSRTVQLILNWFTDLEAKTARR